MTESLLTRAKLQAASSDVWLTYHTIKTQIEDLTSAFSEECGWHTNRNVDYNAMLTVVVSHIPTGSDFCFSGFPFEIRLSRQNGCGSEDLGVFQTVRAAAHRAISVVFTASSARASGEQTRDP